MPTQESLSPAALGTEIGIQVLMGEWARVMTNVALGKYPLEEVTTYIDELIQAVHELKSADNPSADEWNQAYDDEARYVIG